MLFVILQIYVGVMRLTGDSLKPGRGNSLLLDIQPHWSSEQLLASAVKKRTDFLQDMQDVVHVLLCPDGRQVVNIPGTDDPFTVQKYKEAIGKAYQKITLYICTAENFETICKCSISYFIHGLIFRVFPLISYLCKIHSANYSKLSVIFVKMHFSKVNNLLVKMTVLSM